MESTEHSESHSIYRHRQRDNYLKLFLMAVLSFVAMYLLMYAMVYRLGDVYSNIDQCYMALLMTMPMIMIELLVMRQMYHYKTWNVGIWLFSFAVAAMIFILIRQQTAVDDQQFLRAMIPHHSAAILMCNQASLADGGVKQLCQRIVQNQQQEIDLMQLMLKHGKQ